MPCEKHAFSALAQKVPRYLHRIAANKVVAVHKADEFARGRVQPGVARRGYAAVFLMEDACVSMLRGKLVADAAACVGGTVVDQDDLRLVKDRLRLDGCEAARQILFDVVDRYDQADVRVHGNASSIVLSRGACTTASQAMG